MLKNRMESKKLIGLALISIILIPISIPILSEFFNLNGSEHESNQDRNSNYYNPAFDHFLYVNDVDSTEYYFNAKGECYILVEIENTDFTNFTLDGQIINVSYGLNILPIKFLDYFTSHQITLTPEYFKSLTLEPLFLVERTLKTKLDKDKVIKFQAGGPISILVRPTFAYNWLYVELKDANDESTLLKRIHDTAEYPEIDPLFYCLFIERGTYIRYDINLEPGDYKLILRGNGLLEYKILVNSDWDRDFLNDVDEIQQNDMYEEFDLDPATPDIWGFFEKSDQTVFYTSIEEADFTEGYFSFYIPEKYTNNELVLEVNSGEFKQFIIDDDYSFLEGEVLISNRTSPPDSVSYGEIESGWHSINYKYKTNFTSEINFLINNYPIKVLTFSELKDTDGDGIKDLQEVSNSLNPSKIDTDEDGIPDNLDASPLAKLELDPQKIYEVVIPTGLNDDTIIDLQIKKPINDYSTNGNPRFWREAFNVSIYPVLRMFGNRFETMEGNNITREEMDRQQLSDLWGKEVVLLFNSDPAYSVGELGDSLPTPDPDDWDSEVHFIFPNPAMESISYSMQIPHGHSSKNDERLHLRFDLIWLVTRYDDATGQTSLLHYYDFEEPILVQSMTARELSPVEYILGNPDSYLENQILWTLTQNPALGTPEKFGVSDDIVGSGNVHSFDLGQHAALDRTSTPLKENETEVLYMAGSYQNYDILNKIHLRYNPTSDFATTHQGDFEVYFSSYAVSTLHEDQEYFIGDPEIQGENKILYQIYHHEISENSEVQRASIMGIPIAMELRANSKVLKISHAQGYNVPLDQIPWDDSQLGDRITIQHLTYIERDIQNIGIPFIHFKPGIDICKEFGDNRIKEVEHSNFFFTSQPQMPAESFQSFIDEYWDHVNLIDISIHQLSEYISTVSFPTGSLEANIDQIMAEIDNFKQHTFSELNCYDDFFQFTQILKQDTSELLVSLAEVENQNFQISLFWETIGTVLNLAEEITIVSEKHSERLILGKLLEKDQFVNYEVANFNSRIRMKRFMTGGMGGISVALGILMVWSGIRELIQLAAGQGNLSDFDFGLRVAKAIGVTIAGTLLTVEALLLMTSSVKMAWEGVLSKFIKLCGRLAYLITVVLFLIDAVAFIKALARGEVGATEIAGIVMSALSFISTTLIVVGGLTTTIGAIGAGLGIGAAILLFLAWLFDRINNKPHIRFMDDLCKVSFPSQTKTNMRRNGGLEVGDYVNFKVAVDLDEKNCFWIQSKFMVLCDDWKGSDEDWKGLWANGACDYPFYIPTSRRPEYEEDFTSQTMGATPDLKFRLEFNADYRKFNFWRYLFGINWGWERREYTRNIIEESLGIPVLENNVSSFYSHTANYFPQATLLQEFHSALEEYRYKNAYDLTRKTQSCVEGNRKLTLTEFENLPFYNVDIWATDRPEIEEYYLLPVSTETEYLLLLSNHYKEGWRALNPNTDYTDEYRAHLFGYSSSFLPTGNLTSSSLYRGTPFNASAGYHILVPKFWVHGAEEEFSFLKDLLLQASELPIKSNIETDLKETTFKVRPVKGMVNVSLNLLLDGPPEDLQKNVTFVIIPPEGFSIIPQHQFTEQLSSTINFTFIHDSGPIVLGTYFFDVIILLGSGRIYQETVAMPIEGFSLVEFVQYEAIEPIIPGDFFQAIDVINSGTYEEVVNVSVEGIPENFVYKGLYPDDPLENIFLLELEESRIALMIHPPRHYTTSPGLYTYTFRAQDHVYGSFDETFIGTFEVAEFYDMDFQCINPEITIWDYQTGTYTFELTNLGNVPQEFHISYDDIPFADECLSEDVICLGPGETQVITLKITPTGWGEKEFSINAISEGNSTTIIGKITINDDDVNPPEISKFEIIDTPIDVTVNFNIPNEKEGDDQGISNIKIFIDGILILDYVPDSTQTSFSFTFNDTHGNWFMENGTHEIRVELIDNDFDVPNDALNSSMSVTFETTLEDIYLYVDWQIEVLKNYTDTHLCWLLSKLLNHKLSIAQKLLEKAYALVEQGKITCGLFHDTVAKIMIEITEFRTEIFNNINFINDEDATYIISSLHTIRNNIVLLLGTTSGTEHGIPLALIEINLLNLNDFIEDEINWWNRKCLTCHIDSAAKSLEIAIFKASMDRDLECALSCAQWKLELAMKKVNCLLNKGEFSQEIANTILIEIEQVQGDIEVVKNSI